MRIGNFLDSLEDGEVKYLVDDAIERIPQRGIQLGELNQDPRSYLDEENGIVRREVELDDDFLNLIIGVIADDAMSEPTSENDHIGFQCPGTYAEYLAQYAFEAERGLRVTSFLETFLTSSRYPALA